MLGIMEQHQEDSDLKFPTIFHRSHVVFTIVCFNF